MPSPITGAAREIIEKLPGAHLLTVEGIAGLLRRRGWRDFAAAEALRDEHFACQTLGCAEQRCIDFPRCEHAVLAVAKTSHQKVWEYINNQNGPSAATAGHQSAGGSVASQLFPGSALTFPVFRETTERAVATLFATLVNNKHLETSASFSKRSGSVKLEAVIRKALSSRQHGKQIIATVNEVLSQIPFTSGDRTVKLELERVATCAWSSTKEREPSVRHVVADSDVTLNLKYTFSGLPAEFVERHRIPVNIKGLQAGGPTQAGSGSTLAWVLTRQQGIGNTDDYLLGVCEPLSGPAFNGILSDYFYVVFNKDDLTLMPQVISLLAVNPATGALPKCLRRAFPHFSLDTTKALRGRTADATINVARLRLAEHVMSIIGCDATNKTALLTNWYQKFPSPAGTASLTRIRDTADSGIMDPDTLPISFS